MKAVTTNSWSSSSALQTLPCLASSALRSIAWLMLILLCSFPVRLTGPGATASRLQHPVKGQVHLAHLVGADPLADPGGPVLAVDDQHRLPPVGGEGRFLARCWLDHRCHHPPRV